MVWYRAVLKKHLLNDAVQSSTKLWGSDSVSTTGIWEGKVTVVKAGLLEEQEENET